VIDKGRGEEISERAVITLTSKKPTNFLCPPLINELYEFASVGFR
jgi:hypothetical protein